MILYSIIPVEVVFSGADDISEAAYVEAEYMGETVLVYKQGGGDYTISRLLSTNPRSYLNQKLQPGSIVNANELKIKK